VTSVSQSGLAIPFRTAMALSFPDDCRYADSHEYARQEGDLARVGISSYAVDQLGDIVFVELPEVGASVQRGSSFGTVESVKAVEELVAPLSGVVEARNEAVLASPEELQNDPYGEGWLLVIRPAEADALDVLMDAATYRGKVEGH
jgi:glycine cleavage system H protein